METKYYYSYNTEENAFLGKFPAIKNPRRQTEYLLPAMATFKAPPETQEKEAAIWNGEDWVIEPDFRGEQQVNLETYEVTTVEYVGKIKDGFQSVTSEVAEDIQTNPDKYKVVNGILTDISNTDEYKEFCINRKFKSVNLKLNGSFWNSIQKEFVLCVSRQSKMNRQAKRGLITTMHRSPN